MKKLAGLPAFGRATMLGLKLANPLKFTSWVHTLLTTTTTNTPKDRPCVATTPSPSTTPDEPSQISFWEPLDTCLYSNGAMDSFNNMFDQGLLDFDTAQSKNKHITSSIEPLQMPCPSDRVTFGFEGCDAKPAMSTSDPADSVFEDVHQSMENLASPVNEQAESIIIFPLLHNGNDEMVSFRSLFPDHLLLDKADEVPSTPSNTASILEAHPLCHPITLSLGHGSMVPLHTMVDSIFDSILAADFSPLSTDTASKETEGRTSPQPSTSTRASCSSLSDSPISSRRSSWATSISTHLGDDDIYQSNVDCLITAKPDQEMAEIELIHEYLQYCELIELGDPQNLRDRDFVTRATVGRGPNETITPDRATEDAGDLAVEASGDIAHDDPKAPTIQPASNSREKSIQSDTQSAPDTESTSTSTSKPPSTPAEAAAWAHSYCEEDLESRKLRFLTDDRGREYVLYHDCFHCVPIDLAPEYMDRVQDEKDDDDDGYGSATETCEAARDGTMLGTIPEEEDED